MPRRPAQLEQIRAETMERILASALAAFARHGYRATSVRLIAQDAGVSQGLLYHYWPGKEALLQAIFERSMTQVRGSLDDAADAKDGREALERLVRSALEAVREHADFWRLTYQLRMQADVQAGLGPLVQGWTEGIRVRLEALLRRSGSARPEILARVLFAVIDGAAQHSVLDPEGYPREAVVDEIVRRFLPPRRSARRGSGDEEG